MQIRNGLLVAAGVFFCLCLTAQEPVTLENLRDLPSVGDPVLSPNGQYLLYTVSSTDVVKNSSTSQLILLQLSTQDRTVLNYNASGAQWSPDGKHITFLSSYGGQYGLFRAELSLRGRRASLEPPLMLTPIRQSNHFLGHMTIKNYSWSPDGRYIAFVAADTSSCRGRLDPNDPLIVERTMYKSRTAFSDNCLTRIYLMESSGKNRRMLTAGPYDSHSLSWSPDSHSICFVSNHTSNPDHNYNNDLWKIDIASGQLTRLTDTPGTEHGPVWSPVQTAGIAFPATIRTVNTKDSPPENTAVYLISADGGERINLTQSLDQKADDPQWHPGGEWLYFSTQSEGRFCIYRVRKGEAPQPVVCERGAAGQFDVGSDRVVYTYNAPGQPTEIYSTRLDGSIKERLTFETKTWTAGKRFAKTEEFWFTSFDGTRVQGFVAYPEGIAAGARLPVIHRIHGGPHGMYGYTFSDINELLVAQGYAVVFINPRGSSGYGQKFADGTFQAWGGGDFKDLMAGMDAALAAFTFLDGKNMGVTGGSYGGFMTNWIVTQTNRYKAAVTVASVSNLISFYGTSLYQDLIETEFNGFPWDNYNLLWHFSPLAHVDQVKTPTLLIHGENDIDVPIPQAEEFYIALRKLGVPARFIRYPNEGHGIRQPQHREHYTKELLDWFARYVPARP